MGKRKQEDLEREQLAEQAAHAVAAMEGQETEIEEPETTGGKAGKKIRKEKVNMTVFISSLPYTTTTTDLITHFSFIGPVRSGFVVKDRDNGTSKGVGYITYTTKEDAEKAVADLNNGAFGDSTRKIRVEWAEDRPSHAIRAQRKEEHTSTITSINTSDPTTSSSTTAIAAPTPAPAPTTTPKLTDPNAIRTLVLSGLPKDLDKNTLWKKVRKYDGIESKEAVVYPVEAPEVRDEAEDSKKPVASGGDVAYIRFDTHAKAVEAAKKLHAHIYKGALLSCVLKKRVDVSTRTDGKGANRAGRLIIRNLHWKVTEQQLRALFLPSGPILSINLPTQPSLLPKDPAKPAPPPRARGFAFIWFMLKNDAEKAIEALNGKEIEGRNIAVDWALSKDKWEEVKKDEEKDEDKGKEEAKAEIGEAAEEVEDEAEGDEQEGNDGEDSLEAHDEDAMDVDEKVEAPAKPILPAVEEGSTVFIRNLPFEATEEELRNLFRAFGPLRYAKVTMDRATGRSKGTGFACFWKAADADQVLEEASRVKEVTGANGIAVGAKNPFALPSILTIDPSASSAARLVLHGRTLDVIRAVTREDASQMKEDGAKMREKADKRNTYLMREGVIFPNTPASASLPEIEVEKRVTSFKARRTLLESNPALYISKTRLSIRQLPLFATERTLKRLAIHAAREFDNEVKAETREPLARDEVMDTTLSPQANIGKKAKRGERATIVMQSKIVRQTDKIDPLTGEGKSKGYGFLELRTHQDALKVLRWANNNPTIGTLMKEWFAVELEDLEKRTKAKLVAAREAKASDLEDQELKYKKLQQKVKEGANTLPDGMRQGKTLLIEFSVENIQVVKRRVEKTSQPQERGAPGASSSDNKRKRPDGSFASASNTIKSERPSTPRPDRKGKNPSTPHVDGEVEGRPSKKPRRAKDDVKTESPAKAADSKAGKDKTLGKQLGGVIGRKRQERKKGGK